MNKILIALGFVAILTCALAVNCPDEDENSTATYFPHEIECGKFYECHNGSPELLECPPGTYWDTRLNTCDKEADCTILSTSTTPPPTTPTTPTTEVTDSDFEEEYEE